MVHESAEQVAPPVRSSEALADLIERLEKATGPDRELDFDIAMLLNAPFGAWESFQKYYAAFPEYTRRDVATYTASIDAALLVVPSGFWWTCGFCELTNDASVYVIGSTTARVSAALGPDFRAGPEATKLLHHPTMGRMFDDGFHGDRVGGTVAIALCIAALKARAAISKATGAAS